MLVAFLYLPGRFKYRTSHKHEEARVMHLVQDCGFLESASCAPKEANSSLVGVAK